MRVAVYTDYSYHREDGEIYAERAFALFLAALRVHFESLTLVGRLGQEGSQARYPVGPGVELVALPFYSNLTRLGQALPSFARSLRIFWRALANVDCVWLLGPHPLALAFAALALARRKRVVLGVRQDMPAYVRNRHPRRPWMWLAAWLLEAAFRAVGLLTPVVTVGPELARNYRHSRGLMEITVSLVHERHVVPLEEALERSFDGELRVLAVGRLEQEKNPLVLADALAVLNEGSNRWRLVVCGEGDLAPALEARLACLGQDGRAELMGYVPFGPQLLDVYKSSHVLLHTSWTEGLPGIFPEAFAAGLPVIAADVGGIARALGDAVVLVPPGDAPAAARAAQSLASDEDLRARTLRAGHEYVAQHTIELETRNLARFLRGSEEA